MKKSPIAFVLTKPIGDFHLAEAVGFEPTVRGCRTMVFKTISFGRSDTLPMVRNEPGLPSTRLSHISFSQTVCLPLIDQCGQAAPEGQDFLKPFFLFDFPLPDSSARSFERLPSRPSLASAS